MQGCQDCYLKDAVFDYSCIVNCASQICAVLAAVTEVIRSQGGKETETEYFAALVSAAFVKTNL